MPVPTICSTSLNPADFFLLVTAAALDARFIDMIDKKRSMLNLDYDNFERKLNHPK